MAESENFTLKVYTPAGLHTKVDVASVSLPSVAGEVGVLPQHTRYTGLVGTGIMEFTPSAGGQSVKMVLSGGFASFTGNVFTILADSVDSRESVDKATYATRRAEYQKVVDEGNTYTPEWELAKEKLARLNAIDALL